MHLVYLIAGLIGSFTIGYVAAYLQYCEPEEPPKPKCEELQNFNRSYFYFGQKMDGGTAVIRCDRDVNHDGLHHCYYGENSEQEHWWNKSTS